MILVFWLILIKIYVDIINYLFIVTILDVVQALVFFLLDRCGIDSSCKSLSRFTLASSTIGLFIIRVRVLILFIES